jgi:hypothetical protein
MVSALKVAKAVLCAAVDGSDWDCNDVEKRRSPYVNKACEYMNEPKV